MLAELVTEGRVEKREYVLGPMTRADYGKSGPFIPWHFHGGHHDGVTCQYFQCYAGKLAMAQWGGVMYASSEPVTGDETEYHVYANAGARF